MQNFKFLWNSLGGMVNLAYFQYIWLRKFQQNTPFFGKFLGAAIIQERPLLARVRYLVYTKWKILSMSMC